MGRLITVLLALFSVFVCPAFAATYYQNNFDGQAAGALSLGANWKIMSTGGVGNTPAIRLTYATAGTSGNQATLNLERYNTQEFWLEFDTRIEGTMNGGMKFVKIFGSSSTSSQNNSTIGMDYTSNVMKGVSYYGDTICKASYDGFPGYNSSCIFTPVKTISSIDLRGNVWRHIKIHFVRAAPGTNTGSFRIWVDGVEKASAININNNSPTSSATSSIAYITFGDYTNSNTSTWYFWIDNLTVSSTDDTSVSYPSPVTTEPTIPPANTGDSSFQWGSPAYTVSEGIGTANFTITRTGDSTGTASVDWGTFQNTATVNEDYVGVTWRTETFLTGEASKVVNVQISEDTLIEGNETFTISLANPQNGTLGTDIDASISIIDNDAPGIVHPPKNLQVTQ